MEYKGKLYGKIGNKYFDTSKTSDDWDILEIENKQLQQQLSEANEKIVLLEQDVETFSKDVIYFHNKYTKAKDKTNIKPFPTDDIVKTHINSLPYYGTCTSEYNEGFEDGVNWLKEQLKAKS